LLSLVGVNMLMMLVVSAVYYRGRRQVLLAGIDDKLRSVAVMAREMLPPDYHDRINGADSVADEDFQRIVDRNNRLCQTLGLEYIWSLLCVDGRIVFTTATSPDKNVGNRRHAAFFEPHTNPELYTNTFATMQVTYRDSRDKWGAIRAVLVPSIDARGRRYLFGASVRLTDLERQLAALVRQSACLGIAFFVLSMSVGLWIARVVAGPIHHLTETIRIAMSGGNAAPAEEKGSYEQVMLTRHFNELYQALQEKIAQLQNAQSRLLDQRDSERKLAEDEILEARRMLEESQRMAKLGAWKYDVLTGTHVWSDEVYRIHGVDKSFKLGDLDTHVAFFTPECRPIIREAFLRAVEQGEPYDLELEFIRANGERIWTRASARPSIVDGRVVRVDGNFMDITERKRVEQELKNSQERYRLLFEMESDAIFLIAVREMRFMDANRAAQSLYGYSREELLAMGPYDLSAEPERSHSIIQSAEQEGTSSIRVPQIWHRKKDGARFPVEITGQFLMLNGQRALLVAIRDITDHLKSQALLESWNATLVRRVAERTKEVEKYSNQLRALTERLVLVEEGERRRIADVLHEDLQQTLTATRMMLAVAAQRTRSVAAKDQLSRADGLLDQSIRLSRTLVHDIAVPGLRERDLSFAVVCLGQQMREKFGLTVTHAIESDLPRLALNVYLCLYRAVQELLFNVAKHSGVREAVVRLSRVESGFMQVVVSDSGKGGAAEHASGGRPNGGGFGLFSIRERIDGLGGGMVIESAVGLGTTVTLRVPVKGWRTE